MPRAHAGVVKYHYQDHDSDQAYETPPVQNTWYEVFDAEDVRLLWCVMFQNNTEVAAKEIEVRWTIDGTVYFLSRSLAADTNEWIYRNRLGSTGGIAGLNYSAAEVNAAFNTDKRGHSFKVEIRMTDAPGTAQVLSCLCVRETLEET